MKDIAKNIRQLRCGKNMTQDELAEKLFVTRQTVSNYENGKSRPDVEMLARIAEALNTDINSLIYGPVPDVSKLERLRLAVGGLITILLGLCYMFLTPILKKYAYQTFNVGWYWMMQALIAPMFLLFAGWTLMQLLGMSVKWEPLASKWSRQAAFIVVAILIIWALLSLWHVIAVVVNDYLFENHIRGEWIEVTNETTNTKEPAWSMLPPPVPEWVNRLVSWVAFHITGTNSFVCPLLGAAVWYLGFPKKKEA